MDKWITQEKLCEASEISAEDASKALDRCIAKVEQALLCYGGLFPGPASVKNFYIPGENRSWTTGFFTGEVWLSYENLPEGRKKDLFLEAGLSHVDSFLERIESRTDVDHHDMGFLYSPSCVAAYQLTGSQKGKRAAVLAADQLITRFQEKGQFLQAWGEMGARDNYRFIIDCLLNLPLLYWAAEETGKPVYRDIAQRHIHTAMSYVIREDGSTWHTIFMDPVTGAFDHGATCQGYRDGSAWARGQAWGIYGTAVAYKYTRRTEYFEYFRRVAGYFLSHLPDDLCPFWDLTFGNGDETSEPRDSSSAVIAACGMLEMSKYLPEDTADYYTGMARRLMKAMTVHYQSTDPKEAQGQLLHGTYSKKSPYNTCTQEGVDECVIWGDYFFMEALQRLLRPEWTIYW